MSKNKSSKKISGRNSSRKQSKKKISKKDKQSFESDFIPKFKINYSPDFATLEIDLKKNNQFLQKEVFIIGWMIQLK